MSRKKVSIRRSACGWFNIYDEEAGRVSFGGFDSAFEAKTWAQSQGWRIVPAPVPVLRSSKPTVIRP